MFASYSALHFQTARWAAEIGSRRESHGPNASEVAVVFGVMAIEALVNEVAIVALFAGDMEPEDYLSAEKTKGDSERLQALMRLSGGKLQLGSGAGQDFLHLLQLRNGLVHFRFNSITDPLRRTLKALARRGLFDDASAHDWPLGWPNYANRSVGEWSVRTVSGVAMMVADLIRYPEDAAGIRGDFRL